MSAPLEESGLDQLKRLGRYVFVRRIVTLCAVIMSALLQAFVIKVFVNPANLLSGGFTGLAILIDRITQLFGVSFSTSLGMIALNVPVALLVWRSISRRFVIFSMLQVFLASAFLQFCPFEPLLDNTILCVLFGGVLNGIAISLALKSGASTAGTDFIALMVSNKTGRTIWQYVFVGNCVILCIFGVIFGWEHAAYSIIFQFLSTKTIDSFYRRYERVTLQIVTARPQEVLSAYSSEFHHGSTCFEAYGGYSGKPVTYIVSVISSYESDDVIHLIRRIDPQAVINVCKSENFVGNFHRAPADEPLPAEVDGTPASDPLLGLADNLADAIRSGSEYSASKAERAQRGMLGSSDEFRHAAETAIEHLDHRGTKE